MFGIAWGGNEFTPLLVMYRQAGQSAASVDTLLFAYVLGIIPALFLGGPLSDRYGRRAVMLPAPFISMAGSLVLALGSQHFTLLFTGRVLSGIALGLAMAAGSSWVKELSAPPFDRPGAGARRGAMSLTAGFALGAAVAGALAQWGPWPQHLAFLVNIAITIPGAVLALSVPESAAERAPGRLIDDLKIPAARRRRFLFVVMPLAPWVFGSAAVAYAVLPTLIAPTLPGDRIAFSALCCLVCLGCGFTAQMLAPRLDRAGTARLGIIGLALVAVGMALAALAAHHPTGVDRRAGTGRRLRHGTGQWPARGQSDCRANGPGRTHRRLLRTDLPGLRGTDDVDDAQRCVAAADASGAAVWWCTFSHGLPGGADAQLTDRCRRTAGHHGGGTGRRNA